MAWHGLDDEYDDNDFFQLAYLMGKELGWVLGPVALHFLSSIRYEGHAVAWHGQIKETHFYDISA